MKKIKTPNLSFCYTATFGRMVLICTESFDTLPKAIQINHVVKEVFRPIYRSHEGAKLRGSACQLALMDVEWDSIRHEHYLTLKLNKEGCKLDTFAHLFLPTEHIYYTFFEKRLISTSPNDLKLLMKSVSYEGLSSYAYWLSEEIEQMISTFNYSDTEEYQLEKVLKDYNHEVRSNILLSLKADLTQKFRELEKIEKKEGVRPSLQKIVDPVNRMNRVKEVILLREELRKQLEIQVSHLQKIQIAIEKIAVVHHELESLYYSILIIKSLFQEYVPISSDPTQNWVEKILLIHLLDCQLNVISVINSPNADVRSQFVYAIRFALGYIGKKVKKIELIETLFHWRQINRELNHHPKNDDSPPTEEQHKIVYEIKQTVLKVLFKISDQQNRLFHVTGEVVNRDFLTFIPCYHNGVQLLNIDPQTSEAVSLTEDGEALLL